MNNRFSCSFTGMLFALIACTTFSGSNAAEPPVAPATPVAPVAPAVGTTMQPQTAAANPEKRVIAYPGVEVDLGQREIRINATLSEELNWGAPLLEFALMNGKEKGYETLFITEANPAQVQLGLVLLGLRPRELPKTILENPGRPEKFPADMPPLVEVLVRWQTDSGPKTSPIEDLLVQRKDSARPHGLIFAFTGSQMVDFEGKQTLAAALSGYVATVLFNPGAILNLAWYEASPYNDEVSGYCVDVNKLPLEMVRIRKMEINNKGMVDQIVTRPLPVTVILRPTDVRTGQ